MRKLEAASYPYLVCGCPLREGEGRWEGAQPGSSHRLGCKGRRFQGDTRDRDCRYTESEATYQQLFSAP